jgi:hypothetical protein
VIKLLDVIMPSVLDRHEHPNRHYNAANIERRNSIPAGLEDLDDLSAPDLYEMQMASEMSVESLSSSSILSRNTTMGRRQTLETAAIVSSLDDTAIVPPLAINRTTPDANSVNSIHERITKLPREVRNILAGGVAGMMAKSVVAPVDRIKILYQVTSAKFTWSALPIVVQNIIRNEGVTALWKGNLTTMIRVFPYSGIQFGTFDHCKTFLLRRQVKSPTNDPYFKPGLTPLESLVAGMVAGAVSVLLTYPLDLTRTQLAVLRRHRHQNNRGFVDVLVDNYRNRGIAGLFRGVGPTLAGILPYSGIAFALNEQGKREVKLKQKFILGSTR